MFPDADPQVVTNPGTSAGLDPEIEEAVGIDSAVVAQTASVVAVGMLDPRESEAGSGNPEKDPASAVRENTVVKLIDHATKAKNETRRDHVISMIVKRRNMTDMKEKKIESAIAPTNIEVTPEMQETARKSEGKMRRTATEIEREDTKRIRKAENPTANGT